VPCVRTNKRLRSGWQQHLHHVSEPSHRQLHIRRRQSARHRRRFCQWHNLRCSAILAAVWLSFLRRLLHAARIRIQRRHRKDQHLHGVNLSKTYNTRLQPLEMKASSSVGNAFNITYSFVDPSTLKNAGRLLHHQQPEFRPHPAFHVRSSKSHHYRRHLCHDRKLLGLSIHL
jgi:hypothetical protein